MFDTATTTDIVVKLSPTDPEIADSLIAIKHHTKIFSAMVNHFLQQRWFMAG